MAGYTCIDFETTGLFPARHDRVVEVGVVFLTEDGEVEGEWSTLVNPNRDVGPTGIHGIAARDVLGAPTFAELTPALLQSVAGRTVVAHNARFDVRFLRAELSRAGYAWAGPDIPALCTMELAGRYVRSTSRKLGDCCRAAHLQQSGAHEALADARAVAALLGHIITTTWTPPPWTSTAAEAAAYAWPVCDLPVDVRLVDRVTRAPEREEFWLDRIVAGMPRHAEVAVDAYLAVLESALLDRYLSAHEEDALVETAAVLGLDRDRLDTVHRDYLLSMAHVAWDDGVLTKAELNDLEEVAGLLGLGRDDVALSLDAAKAAVSRPVAAGFRLDRGDEVCLTGQMSQPREVLEALLDERGLRPGGLTKRTRLLVAADPDSLSGKAKKAREYGIPIVNEAALLGLLLSMT
ncbi:exonuclease domain-containing protein [Nocardioides sp. QY071]|uniref:exonuclease domain-containing protein n=1 Tax=Nocardioides sp. QY071 TaxID=3044187 RepID=UPI00249CC1F8|nr:exonuclease domain-containing protein [Nocardioides sp. QY071]WGY03876.1 exonuclease domain-containing protein [Nocardioides sp. QY071]